MGCRSVITGTALASAHKTQSTDSAPVFLGFWNRLTKAHSAASWNAVWSNIFDPLFRNTKLHSVPHSGQVQVYTATAKTHQALRKPLIASISGQLLTRVPGPGLASTMAISTSTVACQAWHFRRSFARRRPSLFSKNSATVPLSRAVHRLPFFVQPLATRRRDLCLALAALLSKCPRVLATSGTAEPPADQGSVHQWVRASSRCLRRSRSV